MALQLEKHGTWAKPKVLPVTNRVVTTPISKREAVVFDATLAQYSATEEPNTHMWEGEVSPTFDRTVKEVEVPAIMPIKSVHEGALATVIQIWEGIVLSVDREHAVMTVKLKDRSNLIAEHRADIDLQWVATQDYDLLSAGSVFYWTLYKETKKGSISNNQEIRFRRLPNWTKPQLALMQQEARELSAKFSTENQIAD